MSSAVATTGAPTQDLVSRSPKQLAWIRFKKNKTGIVAACVAAPLLCAVLDFGQPWGGYQIGLELLVLNGLLTWAGLRLSAWRRG